MILMHDNIKIQEFGDFSITMSLASIADYGTITIPVNDNIGLNTDAVVGLDESTPLITGRVRQFIPKGKVCELLFASTSDVLLTSSPITSTGEFRRQSTKQIIGSLISPFGLSVEGDSGIMIDKYNVSLDRPVHEAISDLCISAGLIATTTNTGSIILHNYKRVRGTPSLRLIDGKNCAMKLVLDSSGVANEYQYTAQQPFNSPGGPTIGAKAEGLYPYTKRIYFQNDSITSRAEVQNQCNWMTEYMNASIEDLTVTLGGIQDIVKGEFATVESHVCKLNALRLVESVTYTRSKSKLSTTLKLVPPQKYGGESTALSQWVILQ